MIYAQFSVANAINAHFFVTKMIWAHFLFAKMIWAYFFVAKIYLCPFLSQKEIAHTFCRENALHPESFCALKVAIRKVQTFCASVAHDAIFLKNVIAYTSDRQIHLPQKVYGNLETWSLPWEEYKG